MLWLNANFGSSKRKRKIGENRVRLIYLTRTHKFSNAYMSFNLHINMNHNVLVEDFQEQNVKICEIFVVVEYLYKLVLK